MFSQFRQMFKDQNRVFEIEDRILEIDKILTDEKRKKILSAGVSMDVFLGRLINANRVFENESEKLEKERDFLISRQNSIYSRILWNIVVPIFVSMTTVLLLKLFDFF